MEGLRLVADVVYQGDFCAKLDMSDAYFAINIKESSRPYLAFRWNEEIFSFTCLPFGLATAPYVYTKVMRVLAEYLRARGTRLIMYIDDWAFFASSKEECISHLRYALEIFAKLGLRVNMEKSILSPCQRLEFLGIEIDTLTAQFTIPSGKITRIQEEAASLLEKKEVKARDLSQFIGRVNFTAIASPLSTHMIRLLQRDLAVTLRSHNDTTYDEALQLSERSKEDLKWFCEQLQHHASASFTKFTPVITITSDASKAGWGAVCCGKRTGGRWTLEEANTHINLLELRAAFFGLLSFGKSWHDVDVLLELDNSRDCIHQETRRHY
ncbi:hypothetical protein ANCCAN_08902 [Ancylostoma caninum]|uniref:Reverse transcriptase domain-containing protein n=1 Tax=Ancylostoma caninum TaxID=29170 RepID=A0A368GL34_ANCCA|nr:hypothetical protein ANCCAN_08902 [Ancylostoma caninum]